MSQASAASRTFFARANDLRCRDFSARLSRFVRAWLRHWSERALLLADDPRVCTAWRKGWEAAHYVRLLRWRDEGFKPRVVYDIGAHEGKWSAMVQAALGPERILLFEPQREFQEKAIARQPAGAKWQVVPAALGAREGAIEMNVTANSSASSLLAPVEAGVPASWGTQTVRREKVRVAALDTLVAEQQLPLPDLVKIDVQGYEREVIEGARETFARVDRVVVEVSLITIYRGQAFLAEVAQALAALGLQIEDINEGVRPWPGPPAQMDLWLRRGNR